MLSNIFEMDLHTILTPLYIAIRAAIVFDFKVDDDAVGVESSASP